MQVDLQYGEEREEDIAAAPLLLMRTELLQEEQNEALYAAYARYIAAEDAACYCRSLPFCGKTQPRPPGRKAGLSAALL